MLLIIQTEHYILAIAMICIFVGRIEMIELNDEIIEYPTGVFVVKGTYYDHKNDVSDKVFLEVEVSIMDYDDDASFPESEESRIINEKIKNIILEKTGTSSSYLELDLLEWYQK